MGVDPISISLMAGGMVSSAIGGFMSAAAQKKQLAARQAMTNLQTQNERLDQVRQGRIKQAQIAQMGENQGAGESSSVTTGISGVEGQVESNLGYINKQQGVTNSIFAAQSKELQAQDYINTGNTVSKIGESLFDPDTQAGVKNTYNNIFGD